MSTAPFSFLISPDSYLLRTHITTLTQDNSHDVKVHTFWGDDGLSDVFWEHLTLQSLFVQSKILVVRNAHVIPAATLKELSNALSRASSSVTTLICLEVTFERGKPKIPAHILKLPCFVHAQKKGWITTISALTENSMPQFLQQETKKHNVNISASMIGRLVRLLPLDAARAGSELEKLALTADEQGNIPEDAISLIEESSESTIFDVLRLLQTGKNAPLVWSAMKDAKGESLIFSFLAVLVREARTLWQLLIGEQPALPPQVVSLKRVQAQSLGFHGVAKLWAIALDADKGIKSGEKSPEQAFEILAAELFTLFQPPSRPYR